MESGLSDKVFRIRRRLATGAEMRCVCVCVGHGSVACCMLVDELSDW